MSQGSMTCAILLIAMAAAPVTAQRLDPPGSIAEGGKIRDISPQSTAARCIKNAYRLRAQVECARSDTYQAEQAKRRSSRS